MSSYSGAPRKLTISSYSLCLVYFPSSKCTFRVDGIGQKNFPSHNFFFHVIQELHGNRQILLILYVSCTFRLHNVLSGLMELAKIVSPLITFSIMSSYSSAVRKPTNSSYNLCLVYFPSSYCTLRVDGIGQNCFPYSGGAQKSTNYSYHVKLFRSSPEINKFFL